MTSRTPGFALRLALPTLLLLFITAVPVRAIPPVPSFAPDGQGPNYPDHANGTTTLVPSIEAFALGDLTITLDGKLDDEAWDRAQTGWGFRQLDPDRGAPASVPSVFKVAYDDEAVYFAMACYEDDLANISNYLSRRDQIEASDVVSIYIDPYHDRTTGYNFRVTPAGVKQDAYLFDNGNRDVDWNAVWDAEVHHDADGWYVEIRVPFSAIRFKPADDMTWGLQAYRWMHGRGEDTGWVYWDRNSSGFVSRWGHLTGIKEVSNPRKLEVLPYVLTKHVDPPAEGDADQWQNSQNFGADFKYGVTANLTLNATFQPDFGQVEADPALLNLSPFETFYEEKRPFFVEGARYFMHPNFNLFYSRRIGTGDPNARIRGAAKLTGKIGGDFSLAVLAAATDLGVPGKGHNPFVSGTQTTGYGLVRLGKEFDEGNHRVNLMGTAVNRDKSSFAETDERYQRNGYSGGFDFEMNFADRMYQVSGSTVGTVVDPFTAFYDTSLTDATRYGTGGTLEFRKSGGVWRGRLRGSWESDKLDPNDMGFLSAPDEKVAYGEISYNYNDDGKGGIFQSFAVELETYKTWLYAGNTGRDIDSGTQVWSYERNHRQSQGVHLYGEAKNRSFHQAWVFVGHAFEGTNKYTTRTFADQRGPLMTQPGWTNIAIGGTTDYRKPLSLNLEIHGDWGEEVNALGGEAALRWNQTEHFSHWVGLGIQHKVTNAQWITNLANDGSQPGVTGIGRVDYIFGELDQMIWDLTLRTSVLFDRDRSLQLYLQPFLTRGDYTNPKWLATPDSYDLRPYDLTASAYDFNYGAVNLNLVYRWEYRPGSTVYLVWTHSKLRYEERPENGNTGDWDNDFNVGFPFGVEPGNTLMLKVSYWFNI